MNKRGRFNIFDVLIILVLAGVAAGIIWQNKIDGVFDDAETVAVEYTFAVKNITNGKETYLKNGAELIQSDTHYKMGKITDITLTPSVQSIYLVDGTVETAPLEGNTDALVRVSASGKKRDNGVYLDGEVFIVAGKQYTVETALAVFTVVIEEVIN